MTPGCGVVEQQRAANEEHSRRAVGDQRPFRQTGIATRGETGDRQRDQRRRNDRRLARDEISNDEQQRRGPGDGHQP